MEFYNVICCFLWYLPYYYPIYEFKFNILVFLIMAHPQNLVLPPRATIRDNMVIVNLIEICPNDYIPEIPKNKPTIEDPFICM